MGPFLNSVIPCGQITVHVCAARDAEAHMPQIRWTDLCTPGKHEYPDLPLHPLIISAVRMCLTGLLIPGFSISLRLNWVCLPRFPRQTARQGRLFKIALF